MPDPRYALDHVGIEVSDFARSRAFYVRALQPLGMGVVKEDGDAFVGFGVPGRPSFWVRQAEGSPSGPSHVAFHAAALAAGGRDNGPPGLRRTTRATTARSSSTRTATTSRRSATHSGVPSGWARR